MKKKYKAPRLKNLGKIKNITLKVGSQPDFGGNQFQP
jgi:hypothetical protein